MDFIVRMKFWIAVGALVLISGFVFGVWFVPARRDNSAQMAAWQRTAASVASRAQGEVHNNGDVQNLQDLATAYREDLEGITEGLGKQGQLLEQHFVDSETGDELGPGTWKDVYTEKMDALEEEINKSFLLAPGRPVIRKYYGSERPDEREMREEEKQYWLQKYVMESLAASNKVRMIVPVFSELQLLPRPERLLHPSHGELFEPTAFQIDIATEYESLPMVLDRLLACEIPLNITSLRVERRSAPVLTTRERETVPQQRGMPGRPRAVPRTMPAGAPPTGPMGPGMDAGMPPEAAAAAAAAEAMAAAAMAQAAGMDGMEFRGPTGRPTAGRREPTGGRAPGARAGVRQPTARSTGRLRADREQAAKIPGGLVTVTISGYVLDYMTPEEGEEGGESEQG